MKKLQLLAVLALFTVSSAVVTGAPGEPIRISMVGLIATPERFDGQLVSVTGIGRIEFEGSALYFHREDYDNRDPMNAIWLSIDRKKFNPKTLDGKLIGVQGVFRKGSAGHFGRYSGTIVVSSVSEPQAVTK